ncbi:hypothetical protein ACFV9C_13540 [Kribbella sp. NPDC059898]|uniref:hypothetical protein n=1 Tax=Kribbella sp. NPDC059898 TaxID=3346995 RepID=UPI0036503B66
MWWDDYDRLRSLRPKERGPWVLEQVQRAVPSFDAPQTLLIGKSLGSHAATPAASTAVLGEVATAMEEFLDKVVWDTVRS